MKPIQNNWTLVLAGLWNVDILTPEWLNKFVFDERESFTVEYLATPNLVIRYVTSKIIIIPTPQKITIAPLILDDENYSSMMSFASSLTRSLPHTPFQGIGFNFGFRVEEADDELLAHFPEPDAARFADTGLALRGRKQTRTFRDDSHTINITTTINSETTIDFDFNHHHEASSGSDATTTLSSTSFKGYLKQSQEIMNTVFDIAST